MQLRIPKKMAKRQVQAPRSQLFVVNLALTGLLFSALCLCNNETGGAIKIGPILGALGGWEGSKRQEIDNSRTRSVFDRGDVSFQGLDVDLPVH
jgi:hypothetical protein